MQYLERDVESTVHFATGENEADVLEWLLHLAVSYIYEDMEGSINATGTSLSCAFLCKKSFIMFIIWSVIILRQTQALFSPREALIHGRSSLEHLKMT